jgi:Superfamily II helicase and inactivated derivatives
MPKINKESVQKILSILNNHGVDKINIRSFGGERTTNSIFLTNESEDILKHIELIDSKANIHTTFNYFNIDNKESVGDIDIERIKFILLDIDPVRPSGTASTDKQKAEAKRVFDNCLQYLEDNSIQYYYTFDSGNGYHALIPIDIECTKENSRIIKELLYHLDSKFSSERAHVDKSVHNPARITRLYGTLNTKGIQNGPEYCRISKFLYDKADGNTNDFNSVKSIISKNKVEDINIDNLMTRKPYLLIKDPMEWLSSHNLTVEKIKDLDGACLYKFDRCPMRDHHNPDKGHYFIVKENNKCYFGCHHDSCGNQNIHTFNTKYPCPHELLLYYDETPSFEGIKNGKRYKFYDYILDKTGVIVEDKKKGPIWISTNPIFINNVIYNRDTKEFDYEIQSLSIGQTENTFYLKGNQLNALSLRNILSKKGVMVNNEYKLLTYLQLLANKAKIRNIHNCVGWIEYDNKLVYNISKNYGDDKESVLNKDSIFKLSSSGDYENVISLINNEILGTNMEIALAVSFSPIVLGYISKVEFPGLGAFLINLMGRSSTGKTTALHFIQSVYGSPIENLKTFNSTSNALVNILSDNYGVATVIDELSSSSIKDMTSLVYQIAGGKSKERLNSDATQKEQKTFSTNVICSSEIGFRSKLKDNPGLRMRLIEIELNDSWTKDASSSHNIKKLASKNYGLLANKFMECLFAHERGSQLILDHFKKARDKIITKIPESEYRDRISIPYATILASATLIKELLNIQLDEEKILQLFIKLEEKEIPNRKGIPEGTYEKIIEFVHKNATKFYYDKPTVRSSGKIGIIKKDSQSAYAYIFTGEFEKFLHRELKFEDVKLAIDRLINEEIIINESDKKRKASRIYIAKMREKCYKIKVPLEDYNLIINDIGRDTEDFVKTKPSSMFDSFESESVDDLDLS